ncbi:MAG: DNA mismatch repair protein MutS, partial [Nitrospinaceae bacterium]|nr:DNA mismatch repair protein MutS [Nitrospinaceae bacterium]NIR53248.1 DNA mismatch repair protein MutS [Nitrospinaceae bacterium]NIS83646.1 DNA mismatch repair protein MutS [Nitrospinaceae bacterium]NIT80438.1 DNA mismatch repair protein MutS [Nitrospinaceae bacterium]NIU42773.1 DNA mismatch repair protein MutS [Nitrospinaceae bacterium]
VVRVISPGTVLDDSLLDPKSPHYLVSVHFGRAGVGLAALDMSTGVFKVTEIQGEHAPTQLADELEKLSPKEILVPETAAGGNGRSHPLPDEHDWFVHPREDWTFSHAEAYRTLVEHFKTHSLEGFGCEDLRYAVSAGGALIRYLRDTQKSALKHINSIFTFHIHHSMLLDPTTVKSLELVQSSEGVRKNSLFHLLDLSQTPLGARRIRDWILNPLIDRDAIVERLDRVEAFKENLLLRNDLRKHLDRVYDLERLLGRIALAACSPRDLAALRASLETFPALLALLQQGPESVFSAYLQSWDPLEDVRARIDRTLVDDPPFHLKDGSLIKPGCHEELDRLQRLRRDSKTWIASLETQEKERTGIPVLKVGFNKIYGYYFEVTKKHLDRVPAEYLRKQSLVNAERFISPELKQYESEITSAEEKIQALELDLFQKLREAVAAEGSRIQHMARMIGEIDALAAFAEAA